MTNEEAIHILTVHQTTLNDDTDVFSAKMQNVIAKDSEAFKMAISALERDRWIPVTKKLPKNAYYPGKLCERCEVSTKYGVTEGWYSPDAGGWYILCWFWHGNFHDVNDINFRNGDIPKVIKAPDGSEIVYAWRPLPEPYHPQKLNYADADTAQCGLQSAT